MECDLKERCLADSPLDLGVPLLFSNKEMVDNGGFLQSGIPKSVDVRFEKKRYSCWMSLGSKDSMDLD